VFDHKPSDVFWCTPTSLVTATRTLLTGRSQSAPDRVMFRRLPPIPMRAGSKKIQTTGVNVFYTAPTAIRSLIKAAGPAEEIRPVVAAHSRHVGEARSIRKPGLGTTTSAAALRPNRHTWWQTRPAAT